MKVGVLQYTWFYFQVRAFDEVFVEIQKQKWGSDID